MSVLERRCHQPPKPRDITPTKLQAQIYNHVVAEHVSKGRRAYRMNQNLPKGIFDVHAAQEDSSATTVRLLHINTRDSTPR